MRRSLAVTLAVATLLSTTTGCALNKMQKGAIIGAGAGGAAGAVIGHATGSTVRGAIIGAAVGGVAGGLIGRQMDRQAEELAYQIPGATVQRVGEGITVTFPEGTMFPYDSDHLMPAAEGNMRRFAASLTAYPGTRAMIVGHTDSQGTAVYNADLSERRAQATADFLAGEGIARARLSTAGRGESEPIATNGTDAGRQLNRRVEVAIFADATARSGGN